MKSIVEGVRMSLIFFLSYALFIILYGFLICITLYAPLNEALRVTLVFIPCVITLMAVVVVWMKKYTCSQGTFWSGIVLFCLEYCFTWFVLWKLNWDIILEWPIGGIEYIINYIHRTYYAPHSLEPFVPYYIVDLSTQATHALAVLLYIAFLTVVNGIHHSRLRHTQQ